MYLFLQHCCPILLAPKTQHPPQLERPHATVHQKEATIKLASFFFKDNIKVVPKEDSNLDLRFERRISGQTSSGSDDPGQSGLMEHFRRHHSGQVPDNPVADGTSDLDGNKRD